MKWEVWLLFVITEVVLSLTPGPAVLYVLSQAIRRGPAKSVWASWGILSANAAYLVYLGIGSFLGKSSVMSLPEAGADSRSGVRILRDGFFLQGANPKALLFFTAILPQFIDTRHNIAFQILVLGISSIVVEFAILFTYGQLAGRVLATARSPRFEKVTNRIAGSLLIGAGVGLARLRRT